ncbi:MGH1-like glycoside hydrolase domain-containing protein [Paenibacillus whitsoniae]|uniref:MGH1-like glycoside hydrolase domain-containing protein n=1 Tax=Paenibacillus whitsoniae TaxID=2496558 RepID=UPI001F49AC6F|nr:hypothetical protein [Paenibacillus whitsoniae]
MSIEVLKERLRSGRTSSGNVWQDAPCGVVETACADRQEIVEVSVEPSGVLGHSVAGVSADPGNAVGPGELGCSEAASAAGKPSDAEVLAEWERSGVRFAASSGRLEQVHDAARRRLLDCIVPTLDLGPILQEGGVYRGCWLESTGTINSELLARFVPSVAANTYLGFAKLQREDGLLPYKITEHGPVFRQIQLVTPLARSAWGYYLLHGKPQAFLRSMYDALAGFDRWLAEWRDTRGTGCVEAFCTFDTGHDGSPRFWHVPDTPHLGDPQRVDPHSPVLPFLAPDMTAHVYCQRLILAKMAEALGEPEESASAWRAKAEQTLDSLFRHCYDEEDAFFYDRDRQGELVRVQSDVLLRVLACEVGDRAFFDEALRRYLLCTRKFFTKYPFPSIAMDDPRFNPNSNYNSWAGPTNFLSIIRTAHAFEHHHRYVELTWVMQPLLSAMSRMTRFSQTLCPWTGEEGYTEAYSPAILGVLDYVERLCGILPVADEKGSLWFTGLVPYAMDHGTEVAEETAYSRNVDGAVFELFNTREGSEICRNGETWVRFPYGLRVVTDRKGGLLGVIGMVSVPVTGTVSYEGREIPVTVKGNEWLAFENGIFVSKRDIGVVYPTY